ncbi:hypothetical protein RUM44_008726 [Polyplax serrata]|uniref:Cilia- and flagella-associated protein 157 n=1 Tax=Polyplax serrata TaxID=468196 RepID=A0ABR1BDA7_POLSC
MGPKKGDKKKKKEKEPKPSKTEYLILIAENNAVLAQVRTKSEAIEQRYYDTVKRYEQVQEDVADIIKYLQHEIEVNEAEVTIYNGKIKVVQKELTVMEKHYEQIFAKMNAVFEEKNMEFEHQIQQIKAKLFASEEIKQLREEFLKKKAEFEVAIKEMEIRQEQEIYDAEKQTIIKQDTMQKSMETHLASLIDDFRQASDFAIGEKINKLIRDNIALGNMLTCMQETIENARKANHKVVTEETQLRYNSDLLDDEYKMTTMKHDSRINMIGTIIKSQEELYERISSCQKLIKGNRRLQRQIAEEECLLREKNEEVKNLTLVLLEHETIYGRVEDIYNKMRKQVLQLEYSIFEVAKKVKEGVDIENLLHLEDEQEGESKEDQEENLIEHKFKVRERAIDDVVMKLSAQLGVLSDLQLSVASSEFHEGSIQESTTTM